MSTTVVFSHGKESGPWGKKITAMAAMVQTLGSIQGLMEKLKGLKLSANEPDAVRVSAAEFVLEGLYAHRRISRNEEREFGAGERKREGPREEGPPQRPNLRRQYN